MHSADSFHEFCYLCPQHFKDEIFISKDVRHLCLSILNLALLNNGNEGLNGQRENGGRNKVQTVGKRWCLCPHGNQSLCCIKCLPGSFIPWGSSMHLQPHFLPVPVYDCHIVAKLNCLSFLKYTPTNLQMLISLSVMPFPPVHSNPHPANLYSEFKCHLFCAVFLDSRFPKRLFMLCCASCLILHSVDYLLKVLQR